MERFTHRETGVEVATGGGVGGGGVTGGGAGSGGGVTTDLIRLFFGGRAGGVFPSSSSKGLS